MAENNEGWEVWAERLPDVETKQELPEGVWEDYKKYQMLNNREGDWSAPEMKNPDALTKIRNLMGKVKDLPDTMSYYAHKVADPMYANVDYMGQQVGDWAAKKINNIARAFDVSPEARQYGRFEEEEYDPEAVDVRFGRNAYKEGYDNLGDYLEAKDQEKVDRYRGYNHANRFAPIENADDKFYTLSDTQTMEDWQPETTSGKIAKGAIETAGNMLPENLKALMEEKGIEGGTKMLGALAPFYKREKELWQRYKSDPEFAKKIDEMAGGKPATSPIAEGRLDNLKRFSAGEGFTPEQLQEIEKYRNSLTADEWHELIANHADDPERFMAHLRNEIKWNEYSQPQLQEVARKTRKAVRKGRSPMKVVGYEYDGYDDVIKSTARNEKRLLKGEKPLPNPQAQRAEALARNDARQMRELLKEAYPQGQSVQAMASKNMLAENVEKGITSPRIAKYIEANFTPDDYAPVLNNLSVWGEGLSENELIGMMKEMKGYDPRLYFSKQSDIWEKAYNLAKKDFLKEWGGNAGEFTEAIDKTISQSIIEDLRNGITNPNVLAKRAGIRTIDPYELTDIYSTPDVISAFEAEGLATPKDTNWNYFRFNHGKK